MTVREVAPGIHRKGRRLLTENLVPGVQVYGERLLTRDGVEYRAWNPKRSKLAAALLGDLPWGLARDATILYLGAANGTTVSHVSDVVRDGTVVAVEKSPRAMRDLLEVAERRPNVIPVLADAHRPETYRRHLAGPADLLYQDVAQRDQTRIFLDNLQAHLADGGTGILLVKARSVDVAAEPEDVFEDAERDLLGAGLEITWSGDLASFERDHRAYAVRRP